MTGHKERIMEDQKKLWDLPNSEEIIHKEWYERIKERKERIMEDQKKLWDLLINGEITHKEWYEINKEHSEESSRKRKEEFKKFICHKCLKEMEEGK